MKTLICGAVLTLLLAPHAQASAITDAYSSFFVFGDSLSDNGNLPGPVWAATTGGAPYAGDFINGGVYSNGDVWNQPILDDFTASGQASGNFAFGGAAASGGLSPDLGVQLGLFDINTNAAVRGDNPLASLWFGANDIFQSIADNTAVAAARAAADTVLSGARQLAAVGIDDLLLFGLPDIGITPGFALFQPDDVPQVSAASAAFNTRLAEHAATLTGEGVNVIEIDVNGFFTDLRTNPATYGLTDVVLPCVFPNSLAAAFFGQPTRCDAATAETRLFIDGVHPNAAAHAALGDFVTARIEADLVAPIPLPAGLPLLLTALGGLALARRFRRSERT